MRYSIEPRQSIYVKGFEFFSFAKNIGTHKTKFTKNMSDKYSQKVLKSIIKICNRCNKNCFKKSNSKNCRSNW